MILKHLSRQFKTSYLVNPFILAKGLIVRPRSQNDEYIIIDRLVNLYDIPKTFIEFGFSGWEFNCAGLVGSWCGLLVDYDFYNVKIARLLFRSSVTTLLKWLTLENISVIEDWARNKPIGILSIDVDGNDFWFLQRLIKLKPALIICEYNAFFGHRPLTVPYDPGFDRTVKHQSWTYYGASLMALTLLAESNEYSLCDVSVAGVNCFFIRNDLLASGDKKLCCVSSFRDQVLGPKKLASSQWETISHMEYIDVQQLLENEQFNSLA